MLRIVVNANLKVTVTMESYQQIKYALIEANSAQSCDTLSERFNEIWRRITDCHSDWQLDGWRGDFHSSSFHH